MAESTKSIALIFILLLSVTVVSAEKFQRGTIFAINDQNGVKDFYIVSAYNPSSDTYELTSPTSVITVQRTTVETWTPIELETPLEKFIRSLNLGSIVNGVVIPQIYGDIDGNGLIEKNDAILENVLYFGGSTLNQYQINAGDVSPANGDGIINKTDAVKLIAYYLSGGIQQPDSRIGTPISSPSIMPTPTPLPTPSVTVPVIVETPAPTQSVMGSSTPTPAPTPTPTPIGQKIGTILVWSYPDDAKVYVNDVDKGTTTNNQWLQLTTATGTYTVKVAKSGYQDTVKSVVVNENTQVSVQAVLTGLSSQTPAPSSQPTQLTSAPTPIPQTPGFESILAITGILIVTFMVLRQKEN